MRSLEQDVPTRIRTLQGSVLGTGAINSGTGFSVVKTGTGVYVIYFAPRFRYILGVSMALTAGGIIVIPNNTFLPESVSVFTYNNSAAAADQAFNFMVSGVAA
jgi:hypothetical protein